MPGSSDQLVMKLGTKLIGGSALSTSITVLMATLAFTSFLHLDGILNKIMHVNSRKLYLAGRISTDSKDLRLLEANILLSVARHDPGSLTKVSKEFQTTFQAAEADVEDISHLIETPHGQGQVKTLRAAFAGLRDAEPEFLALAKTGDLTRVNEYLQATIEPLLATTSETSQVLSDDQPKLMQVAVHNAEGTLANTKYALAFGLLLSLGMGAFLLVTVRRSIRNLQGMVGDLSQGAEQVLHAAQEVSASSQALAQGASEQAASLEETSASTEEIGSMTRRNSENSRNSAELATLSVHKFEESNQFLMQSVQAMDAITTSSEQIAKIIKVINEIAFQTNILALNAAVEAARAGEAGMGFAVVADEVRHLAQRCAQAAKDTERLIADSIAKSGEGQTRVNQTAAAIRAISGQATQMKTLADEVNLGSEEQLRGIEQIAKAITQMEQVTQTAAASAEESAAAAEELNAQSAQMQEVVKRLRQLLGGEAAPELAARAQSRHPQPEKTKVAFRSALPVARKPLPVPVSSSPMVAPVASEPSGKAESAALNYADFPLEEESFKEF